LWACRKERKQREEPVAPLRTHPLHVGTITRQISKFCRALEPATVDLPLICWYIEGSDKRILVDTGGGDPATVPPAVRPYRGDKDQITENALKKIGVSCEEIDIVIVTHLHWDHMGGNALFPNEKIIIQSEELRSPGPFPVAAIGDTRVGREKFDYTVISGDTEVVKRVKVILTPGHTDGLQGVLVEGETRIFIASDTLPLFKNIESDPPVISDICVDLEQYQTSMKKIAELSTFVLPGHDFRVFEREVYF
jgi:N-acyl homoserine lactone hydrolase